MTEFEKKLLLSKEEYEYLMECFGYKSPLMQKPIIQQVNYYFDTSDFSMNRQNITCRIRLKDGKYKAMMKQHSCNADYSTETEMAIYSGLEKNAFIEMGLQLQGKLVTERCVILKDDACEVVLDKNEYLGHIDYELEIEYMEKCEKNALSILEMIRNMLVNKKYFLAYDENFASVPSKSNRFFDRMRTNKVAVSETDDVSSYDDIVIH